MAGTATATKRESPPENEWLTKIAVQEKLGGVSGKSIDRYVARGLIERRTRKVPGRVDLPIFNPIDVDKIAKQTITVTPAGESASGQALAVRRAPSDLAGFLAELREVVGRLREPAPSTKLFLNLEEAAALSGMPKAWLLRKIQAGELPAIKAGGWRIRRADLDKL